jgi:uncharacterized Zn-binding protein involved in type VI secretion
MPGVVRIGDISQAPPHAHGCPGCPHPAVGPALIGSPNVLANGLPIVRKDDIGTAAACCGPNMWKATGGSATVFANGKPIMRQNDQTRHCDTGSGTIITASTNVIAGS